MKKYFSIFLLVFITTLTAQEAKHLTLEDAVLGRSKGLYPKNKSIQWVSNSDMFSFSEKNALFTEPAFHNTKEKRAPILQLQELQKGIKGLKRLPYFSSISSEEVTFNHQNEIVIYDYIQNNVSETISYPPEAQNNDYNEKAKAVAYTIDNNLYLANTKNPKIAITNSNDKNIVSGQAIARSEFGITHGIFLSLIHI